MKRNCWMILALLAMAVAGCYPGRTAPAPASPAAQASPAPTATAQSAGYTPTPPPAGAPANEFVLVRVQCIVYHAGYMGIIVAPGVCLPSTGKVVSLECGGKAVEVADGAIADGIIASRDFGEIGVRFASNVITVGAGTFVRVNPGYSLPERAVEVYVHRERVEAFLAYVPAPAAATASRTATRTPVPSPSPTSPPTAAPLPAAPTATPLPSATPVRPAGTAVPPPASLAPVSIVSHDGGTPGRLHLWLAFALEPGRQLSGLQLESDLNGGTLELTLPGGEAWSLWRVPAPPSASELSADLWLPEGAAVQYAMTTPGASPLSRMSFQSFGPAGGGPQVRIPLERLQLAPGGPYRVAWQSVGKRAGAVAFDWDGAAITRVYPPGTAPTARPAAPTATVRAPTATSAPPTVRPPTLIVPTLPAPTSTATPTATSKPPTAPAPTLAVPTLPPPTLAPTFTVAPTATSVPPTAPRPTIAIPTIPLPTGTAVPSRSPTLAVPTARITPTYWSTPLPGSIPAGERAGAARTFAYGLSVYIYGPQPAAAEPGDPLGRHSFTLRYLVAGQAVAVPNSLAVWKYDAGGARILTTPQGRVELADWNKAEGMLTFVPEPDGSGTARTAYLEVALVAAEPSGGSRSVSESSRRLSNTVRIRISPSPGTPGAATPAPGAGMPALLPIPAGTFQRGCDRDVTPGSACSSDTPLYTVYLDAFRIDRTETTNAQYARCVAAGGCTPPASRSSSTRASYYDNQAYAAYPVVWVTWQQAGAYCAWAGKRLPTAAEWEKAARGPGDTRGYPWGDIVPDCTLANYAKCAGDTTAAGSYPAGSSPYGALDMIGNVREWAADWFHRTYSDYDRRLFTRNPLGPVVGQYRETLGGGWDTTEWYLRLNGGQVNYISTLTRSGTLPAPAAADLGFRCAASGDGAPSGTALAATPPGVPATPPPDGSSASTAPSKAATAPLPAVGGTARAATATRVASAVPTALPPLPSPAPSPAFTPPAGRAGAAGRVLWNDQPVPGVAVNLCSEYSIMGCKGTRYETTTNAQGAYAFDNVAPNPYYLAVHAIDREGWFLEYPADSLFLSNPVSRTLAAGQVYRLEDMHIWKYDLAGGAVTPAAKPGGVAATLSWKAYPGAAYYGVYIGVQIGEERGERTDTNTIDIASPPAGVFWRVAAYNDRGRQIAESRYLDFGALRSPPPATPAPATPVAAATAGGAATARPTPTPAGGGQQAGQPVPFQAISCPTGNAAITAITVAGPGWWNIAGVADIAGLDYWKCEISSDGSRWSALYRSSQPVKGGVLVEFKTGSVPPGSYQVRLTAVDRTGNFPEPCTIRVSIP